MKRKLFLNTVSPLLLEIVTVISGFLIPKLIILNYGSEVNGLVASITQFLSVITFFEAGVGSVIRYNLYKPLSEGDDYRINSIVVSANRFFRHLALILLIYTGILMAVYPFFAIERFSYLYTALLIATMSISFLSQYYFGQVNQLLLMSDQKGYIQYFAQIVTVVLNTCVGCFLMIRGAGIHLVKLVASFVFLLRALFLQWYVIRNYSIDYKIEYKGEPIKQKWNGLAQHISAVILDGTDVIVLTLFSSLATVSIYSVHNMVVSGVKKLMTTSTGGIEAALGDMIARENSKALNSFFEVSEWIIHTAGCLLFGCTAVLISSFIRVYTKNVVDADYNVPLFAFLITMANFGHTLRLPYSYAILTSGHYKQTQGCYVLASVINITVSIILVTKYGLIGVAVGTIIAMLFQTIWMGLYSGKNIIIRSGRLFWQQLMIDILSMSLILLAAGLFTMGNISYMGWCILAIKVFVVSIVIILAVNGVFCRNKIRLLYNYLRVKKNE